MEKEPNNAAVYVVVALVGAVCGAVSWVLGGTSYRRRDRFSAAQRTMEAQASALNQRMDELVARSNELVKSCEETDKVYREVMEAAAAPAAPLALTKSVREAVEGPSAEEVVKAAQEQFNQWKAERSATEEPEVKVSVVLPWRFNRPTDIPRPEVVDARRLAKLPERDIRLALHRAYADDTVAAKKLHSRLRGSAERAVFPLREDAVGALEDIYVVHPDRVMHD